MYVAGIFVLLAFVLILVKLGATRIKRLLNWELQLDIIISITMAWLLGMSGTFSGMIAGLFAGFLFSVLLFIIKRVYGWEELRRLQCKHCSSKYWKWIPHSGMGWSFLIPWRKHNVTRQTQATHGTARPKRKADESITSLRAVA